MMKQKNFRKRRIAEEEEEEQQQEQEDHPSSSVVNNDDHERRLTLEEIKFLQKQREKKSGIPALVTLSNNSSSLSTITPAAAAAAAAASSGGLLRKSNDKSAGGGGGDGGGGDADKDDLVLQDTFAQETAVMVEDPIMLRYIEQELAKKRGKNIDFPGQGESDVTTAEDELYKIPDHLKVKKRNSGEGSTQWTTGIAEVQLPIEYKLKNIEDTEAAKKLLQEKRLTGRMKTNPSIPSSYSADYFQRGKDYAEKLRREHPELYKDRAREDNVPESGAGAGDSGTDGAVRRQAATDELMLKRFRKRERHRVMRR